MIKPNFPGGLITIVIDTNLLLVLLGYQCSLSEKLRALERVRILNKIRGRTDALSPECFDDLWQRFLSANRRIVTQHVVAETYGLRKRLSSFGERKELVWDSALALLFDPGIEELTCGVQEISRKSGYIQILKEIGPADSGLIYTAEQLRATILTDDGGLAHWAAVRSVEVIRLNQMGVG